MKQSTKNVLLIAGFFLILVVAYQYSFSKTLEIKRELDELNMQVAQNSGSVPNINSLKGKEIYLDSIIAKNRTEDTSLQNSLLKALNEHSELWSYKIISFKEPHVQIAENGQNKITSFQFVLQGEYKNLEEILYKLENDYSFGSLSNINLERKKDYRLNKNFLQCDILIQYIE